MRYNFGESIANLVSGLIFVGLAFLVSSGGIHIVYQQFILLAVIGVTFAILNGIPLKLAAINNDGYNAISLGKNKEALRSFWIQLKINEQIAAGIRLKDMPMHYWHKKMI